MKRVITIAVCVLVAFALGIFVARSPDVHAGGAGPVASQNGDVNGDGELNLSDAIYLLNALFRGGPQPVSCPGSTANAGLPDTGQRICYDQAGKEIPCDSGSCPGQDGSYATGCPAEGRFVDNQDGTVTDTCTGLMWQKETADVNRDGQTIADLSDSLPWCNALAYCENLSFAGHDDWRLPSVRELQSIVDYRQVAPSIDPVFHAFGGALYWSSTTYATDPSYAWEVTFGHGEVNPALKAAVNTYVRAVRSAP
jgi:hypothetical protein